jgi:RNA polymerase sigma-70 factor (ECF subfamily)
MDDSDSSTQRFLDSPTEEHFRRFFTDQVPGLVRYFRSWGCDEGTAEELAQDVLLTVFREVRQLRDRNSFRAWVLRIAHNAVVHRWKKDRVERETLHLDELDEGAFAGNRSGEGPGTRILVTECLDWLTPEDRHIMILRYMEGLEYHEMAEVLQMRQGTVQWRVFEIRKRLAARLGSPAGSRQ